MPDYEIRTSTDEKELLTSFLDRQRDAMVAIGDGLSDEDLRRRLVPSMTTILGMMKHIALCERWWFQDVFEGRPCEYPIFEDDWDADFRVEPTETTQDILDLYRTERSIADEIIAAHNLDDVSVNSTNRPPCTLRWTILHVAFDIARHAGHADILREQLDGRTALGIDPAPE